MKHNASSMRLLGGYSLIELMVSVLIVGILASVSVGYYGEYVKSGHRAEAKSTLLQLANALERCRTENNAYDHNDCDSAAGDVGDAIDDVYDVSADRTATTYTLAAAPVAGGVMAGDGDYTLTHTGAKTYKGSAGWND